MRAIAILLVLTATASAQPRDTDETESYFTDGGMVPFVYVPAAVLLASTLAEPPTPPLGFSAAEGGAEARPETIPSYQVGVLAGGLTLSLALFDRKARWYHAKGMVESLATTAALTELAKVSFGRHRPSFDPAMPREDDRKSFFSGHASLTAASTVYFGLYLRRHVFAEWRGDQALAWWEVPAYASLVAVAAYVPYTRVADHKHHVSDVVVGTAVGTSLSVAFFLYQERRYQRASRFGIVPLERGLAVVGSF